jgi:hypothetical protein
MSSREVKPNPRVASQASKYAPAALEALYEIITRKSASASARVAAAHIMLTYASMATPESTQQYDYTRLNIDEARTLVALFQKAKIDTSKS